MGGVINAVIAVVLHKCVMVLGKVKVLGFTYGYERRNDLKRRRQLTCTARAKCLRNSIVVTYAACRIRNTLVASSKGHRLTNEFCRVRVMLL